MDEFAEIAFEFNKNARRIFFSLYEKFRESIQQLNRKKDENVFQQQQAKYLQTLKTELEYVVKGLLEKNKSTYNMNQVNKKLTDEIAMYLNEFRQKTRSL